MKKLFLALALLTLSAYSAEPPSYYDNFCKENPYEPECYSHALGGTDDIKKERRRESVDEYKYDHDDRRYPSEDMDDPRETL